MNPPPLPSRPGPVARFFVGLWDVMNFTRRLILNLLFFGLLLLVLIVFLAAVGKGSSGVVPVHERTTLVPSPTMRRSPAIAAMQRTPRPAPPGPTMAPVAWPSSPAARCAVDGWQATGRGLRRPS